MANAILGGVEQFPAGEFLYFDRQGEKHSVSYKDTLDQARRLVAGFRESGMQPGDALLVTVTEARQIVPAIWATAIGGFVAVPSSQSSRSRASGMSGPEHLAWLGAALPGLRILVDRPAIHDQEANVLTFADLVSTSDSFAVQTGKGRGEDLRFVIMTSGTTGRPRLVGLSDDAALARWWPKIPDASHARSFLSWSAFDHVMGLGLAMPNLPQKVHLDASRFAANPLSWLDALDATGATHATMTNFGMTLILRAVSENPGLRWRLDQVRKIGIGAEAISGRTCERFLTCLSAFGLRQDALILGYGLSECGPVVGGGVPFSASGSPDADAPPELDRPTMGHAVRIVGDSGYLLREGEAGLIEVRGPTMTCGYLGDPEATAALFTADRWLRTGDLGFLRDGKLTVVGREKELILVNARKYTCLDVEAAVRSRTGFQSVYVAPLETAHGDDDSAIGAPCAVFVVADPAGDFRLKSVAEEVRAAIAEAFRFAPRIVALISHDQLQRTSLGKVRRLALPGLLADLIAEGRAHCLTVRESSATPSSAGPEMEARIERIWCELLRSDSPIDREADFFAVGGDSLLALRMSFLIEDEFGVALRVEQFAGRLSIAELALFLSSGKVNTGTLPRGDFSGSGLPDWLSARLYGFLESWPGVPALPGGFIRQVGTARQGTPLFWCMQTSVEAQHLGRTVGRSRPAYAMRSGVSLVEYDTVPSEALVGRYFDEITEICREGPIVLGGNCQGVNFALAVVRRLVSEGREVQLLAAADCRFAEMCGASPVPVPVALFPAVGSKFNPYRYFRHPEIGLRKLAPKGLRIEMINSDYARIMVAPAMDQLADGVEAAITWATSDTPRDEGVAVAPISASACQRNITSPLETLELKAGEIIRLSVELENSSAVAWEPFESSGLMVANHWLSENGEVLTWSDGRSPLEQKMKPGARARITLTVTAPREPGRYRLEVDLVEEGIRWFGDVGSAPLYIPALVLPQDEEEIMRKWETVRRSRVFRLHQFGRKLLGLPHLL